MIGRWIDAQDDEVLGRLARVPEGHWMSSLAPMKDGGPMCLMCHAFGAGNYFEAPREGYQPEDDTPFCFEPEKTYMELTNRFGDARIGHLISERARRTLMERNSTSPDTVDTENGEPIRTFVHVSLNCEPVEVGA